MGHVPLVPRCGFCYWAILPYCECEFMKSSAPLSKPTTPFECSLLEHSFKVEDESIPGIEDGTVRLAFADPPYNLGVQYADDPTGDWLPESDYFQWCQTVIQCMARTLVPGGTLWWLCPEEHGDVIGPMLKTYVGPRLHRVIWRESFAQYQESSLTKDYRFLFCHIKKPVVQDVRDWDRSLLTFNPDLIREPSVRQLMGDKRADPRGRVPGQVWAPEQREIFNRLSPELQERIIAELSHPGDVWDIRRLQGTAKDRVKWHPTQLPPELLKRIVLGWSNPGDLVLDSFGGSGTMGEVCKTYGRRCVLVEQSPTYLNKIQERLGLDSSCRSGSCQTAV